MKIHSCRSIKTLLMYVTHGFTKKTEFTAFKYFSTNSIHKPCMRHCLVPKIILKAIDISFLFLDHTKTATRQWKDSLNFNNISKVAKIEIKSYLLDPTMKCSWQLWQKNSKPLEMASGLSLVHNFSIQSSFHQLTGNKKVHIFSEHHKIWKQSSNFIYLK